MKKTDELVGELSQLSNRYDRFYTIFTNFQQSINHLQDETFPVRTISLETITGEKTIISFIGRTYELAFSSCVIDGSFKGKISASRVLDEDNTKEITSITYNGQSPASPPFRNR